MVIGAEARSAARVAMETTRFLLGDSDELAAGIRRFRSKYDLSQSDMAAHSNVSLRTLQYLEGQGGRPTPLTVLKLDEFMRKFERAKKKATA
jgi:DNA-binding transcriptional regulator YiaG